MRTQKNNIILYKIYRYIHSIFIKIIEEIIHKELKVEKHIQGKVKNSFSKAKKKVQHTCTRLDIKILVQVSVQSETQSFKGCSIIFHSFRNNKDFNRRHILAD